MGLVRGRQSGGFTVNFTPVKKGEEALKTKCGEKVELSLAEKGGC